MLFGTPAYCESQFCGPEVTELERIAAAHPDRAVFIHVEIWKDFDAQPQVMNEGAADWLLRTMPDGTQNMTEPWLYLIGADGIIVDRWGSLFESRGGGSCSRGASADGRLAVLPRDVVQDRDRCPALMRHVGTMVVVVMEPAFEGRGS